jgi:hypothetical protein
MSVGIALGTMSAIITPGILSAIIHPQKKYFHFPPSPTPRHKPHNPLRKKIFQIMKKSCPKIWKVKFWYISLSPYLILSKDNE